MPQIKINRATYMVMTMMMKISTDNLFSDISLCYTLQTLVLLLFSQRYFHADNFCFIKDNLIR